MSSSDSDFHVIVPFADFHHLDDSQNPHKRLRFRDSRLSFCGKDGIKGDEVFLDVVSSPVDAARGFLECHGFSHDCQWGTISGKFIDFLHRMESEIRLPYIVIMRVAVRTHEMRTSLEYHPMASLLVPHPLR